MWAFGEVSKNEEYNIMLYVYLRCAIYLIWLNQGVCTKEVLIAEQTLLRENRQVQMIQKQNYLQTIPNINILSIFTLSLFS